ncbi:MAG: ComF family protein [Symbiobacteriaceae bacterium]|nr:ComF family protein [Symbiobacteriaceae bacterium]
MSFLQESRINLVSRLLFPPYSACTLCGVELELPLDDGLCPVCLANLPPILSPYCPRCGLPGVDLARECPDCAGIPPSFLLNRSLWRYQGEVQKLVGLFKFSKRAHLAYTFAQAMHKNLFCNLEDNYDIITYVPMHYQGVRERGYNQSELVARELSALTGIASLGLLQKPTRGTPQHFLGREDRWAALSQGVFTVSTSTLRRRLVSGKVLLIDDVFTTGATAHYCSQALLLAGAAQVAVLTVAR